MSFLSQLAKGFIRSAVNQVGRDGGKVISNKVYVDSHSTPIRVTSGNNQGAGVINEPVSPNYSSVSAGRAELEANGYQPEPLYSSFVLYILMFIGACILVFIGPLYFLIKGVMYLTKKETTFNLYGSQAIYVADRRYKTGKRVDGHKTVKKDTIKVPATPSERSSYITKGALSMVVFLIFAAFYGFIMIVDTEASENQNNVPTEPTTASAVITAQHGLNMRSEGNQSASVISNIPKGDTVRIISNKDGWYQVNFQEKEGWVSGDFIELVK